MMLNYQKIILPGRRLRGFESGKVGPKDGSDFIGVIMYRVLMQLQLYLLFFKMFKMWMS